jgi:hypothetical protein
MPIPQFDAAFVASDRARVPKMPGNTARYLPLLPSSIAFFLSVDRLRAEAPLPLLNAHLQF